MILIHTALLAGQVLFAVVSFVVTVKPPHLDVKYNGDPYMLTVPLLALVCFACSNIIFKLKIAGLPFKGNLIEKLISYLTALIIRFALLEGASLFGIVTFLLTGNLLYILIASLLMFYTLVLRPTIDSVEANLQLSYDEKQELEARE